MNETQNAPHLRMSMSAGAWYDAIVGVSIVGGLPQLSKLLLIPYPAEPFYARMQGVLLIGLAIFYGIAAHDLERNLRNVAGAIAIRLLGGLYLAVSVPLAGIAPFFYVFAIADIAFGVLHLALLNRERHARFWPLLLRGEVQAV